MDESSNMVARSVMVSVVMPMRDAGSYLQAAVDSVVGQEHRDLELIVVDDGSQDGSRERILSMVDSRIRLVDGPRSGISACLNTGFAEAVGEVVMRCDADDLYPPGRIARQVAWLGCHPGFIAVCGSFSMVGPNGAQVAKLLQDQREERTDAAERILDERLKTHLCTFAIRRAAVERLGGFRPWFETAEDIDFALRLAELGPIGFDPFEAYVYRLHATSVTHTQASTRRLFYEEQARKMSRERRTCGTDAIARGEPPALPEPRSARDLQADSARLHVAQLLVGESWSAFAQGRRGTAIAAAARALLSRPVHTDAWKALLLVTFRRHRG